MIHLTYEFQISKLSLFDFNEIRHLPAELHKSDRVDDFIVSILNSVEEYNARRSNVLRVEAMETDEPENNVSFMHFITLSYKIRKFQII